MAGAGLAGTGDIPLSVSPKPRLGLGSCWCLPGLAHPRCFSWLCGRRAEGRGQQSKGAPSQHRELPAPRCFQVLSFSKDQIPLQQTQSWPSPQNSQTLIGEGIFCGTSFVFTSTAIFIINQTVVQQLRVGKGTADPCSYKNRAEILLLQQNLPGKAQPCPHCHLSCC